MSSPYRSQLTILRALNLAKQALPTAPFWDNGLNFLSAWNRLGYIPRLDIPRSFNEHILQQKRNFQKNLDLAAKVADKYFLKEWVRSLGYHDLAVPTLGVYSDARELDGHLLEKNSILKPTHLSGTVIPVYTPRTLTEPELRTASRWLKTDLYKRSREIVYRNLQRRIIHEELMLDENGNVSTDYKFFPDYVPSSSCSIDRVDCAVGSVQRAPTRSEWAARRHVSGPNPVPVPVWSLEHEVRT